MEIGSLLDNTLCHEITYSYYHRGTNILYNPDKVKEETNNVVFTKENGNLFFGREVSWCDSILLRDGVDIKFNLNEKCFIDHLSLVQGDCYITHPDVLKTIDSMFESIEIITVIDNEEKLIARYTGETDKKVSSKDISVNVGFYCDNLIVRINGCCMPLSIKKLDIWAAWGIENAVFPLPDSKESLNSSFLTDDLKTIKVTNENENFVADYLNEKLLYKFNRTLIKDNNKGDVEIILKEEEKDNFSILTENGKCTIHASNRRSALYAVDAFMQTIKDNKVNCCKIEHTPYKDIRGVHFALPNKDQLSFMENLIKYVFVPNHYNMLYLQLSGAMRYKKFPEINEEWVRINEEYEKGNGPMPAHYGFIGKDIWEHEEISSLCRLFESYGIEVVPEIQAFGHAQYITCAYPETAEKKEEVKEVSLDIGAGELTPSTKFYHVITDKVSISECNYLAYNNTYDDGVDNTTLKTKEELSSLDLSKFYLVTNKVADNGVYSSENKNYYAYEGSIINYTADGDEDYTIIEANVNSAPATVTDGAFSFTVNGDTLVSVTFTIPEHAVTEPVKFETDLSLSDSLLTEEAVEEIADATKGALFFSKFTVRESDLEYGFAFSKDNVVDENDTLKAASKPTAVAVFYGNNDTENYHMASYIKDKDGNYTFFNVSEFTLNVNFTE